MRPLKRTVMGQKNSKIILNQSHDQMKGKAID
jgi:hypothetical protein